MKKSVVLIFVLVLITLCVPAFARGTHEKYMYELTVTTASDENFNDYAFTSKSNVNISGNAYTWDGRDLSAAEPSNNRTEITSGSDSGIISGIFNDNHDTKGAAILNHGNISTITDAIFVHNTTVDTGSVYSGAIHNTNKIGDISADFVNNNATTTEGSAYGGAIYSADNTNVSINSIKGDFIGNYVDAFNSGNEVTAKGGAIYNSMSIGSIEGDFVENFAKSKSATHDSSAYGGAIYNTGVETHIDSIKGNFINNSVSAEAENEKANTTSRGGAIYNKQATIGNISGSFIGNSASQGGAIFNDGGLVNITSVEGYEINFANNKGKGSAIYNDLGGSINITADTADIKFSGNNSDTIYNNENNSRININAKNNREIRFADSENIYNEGYLTIGHTTDSDFNGDIYLGTVSGKGDTFKAVMTIDSGKVYSSGKISQNEIFITSTTNGNFGTLTVDADKINTYEYVYNSGVLNLRGTGGNNGEGLKLSAPVAYYNAWEEASDYSHRDNTKNTGITNIQDGTVEYNPSSDGSSSPITQKGLNILENSRLVVDAANLDIKDPIAVHNNGGILELNNDYINSYYSGYSIEEPSSFGESIEEMEFTSGTGALLRVKGPVHANGENHSGQYINLKTEVASSYFKTNADTLKEKAKVYVDDNASLILNGGTLKNTTESDVKDENGIIQGVFTSGTSQNGAVAIQGDVTLNAKVFNATTTTDKTSSRINVYEDNKLRTDVKYIGSDVHTHDYYSSNSYYYNTVYNRDGGNLYLSSTPTDTFSTLNYNILGSDGDNVYGYTEITSGKIKLNDNKVIEQRALKVDSGATLEAPVSGLQKIYHKTISDSSSSSPIRSIRALPYTDITNDGTLILNGKDSAASSDYLFHNTVKGTNGNNTGNVEIKSGKVELEYFKSEENDETNITTYDVAKLSQKGLKIDEGATLVSEVSALNIGTDAIENAGTLILRKERKYSSETDADVDTQIGTLTSNITSGGNLVIAKNTIDANGKTVDQGNLTVNGGARFIVDAANLKITSDTVWNNGILQFKGGTSTSPSDISNSISSSNANAFTRFEDGSYLVLKDAAKINQTMKFAGFGQLTANADSILGTITNETSATDAPIVILTGGTLTKDITKGETDNDNIITKIADGKTVAFRTVILDDFEVGNGATIDLKNNSTATDIITVKNFKAASGENEAANLKFDVAGPENGNNPTDNLYDHFVVYTSATGRIAPSVNIVTDVAVDNTNNQAIIRLFTTGTDTTDYNGLVINDATTVSGSYMYIFKQEAEKSGNLIMTRTPLGKWTLQDMISTNTFDGGSTYNVDSYSFNASMTTQTDSRFYGFRWDPETKTATFDNIYKGFGALKEYQTHDRKIYSAEGTYYEKRFPKGTSATDLVDYYILDENGDYQLVASPKNDGTQEDDYYVKREVTSNSNYNPRSFTIFGNGATFTKVDDISTDTSLKITTTTDSLTFEDTSFKNFGTVVENQGTATFSSSKNQVKFTSGSNIMNLATGTLNILAKQGEATDISFDGTSAINNLGIMNINDSTHDGNVILATVNDDTTPSGTTNINAGNVKVLGSLFQKTVDVKAGAALDTFANVTSTDFFNAGTVTFHGTSDTNIAVSVSKLMTTGSDTTGTLNVGNYVTLTSSDKIKQQNVYNLGTISANSIDAAIINDGTITVTSDSNISSLSTSATDSVGNITFSAGSTTVTGVLKQRAVTVGSGATLTANASSIDITDTTDTDLINNGTLKLNGTGSLSVGINGNGNLCILETLSLSSAKTINQKTLDIVSGKTFTNTGIITLGSTSTPSDLTGTGTLKNDGILNMYYGSGSKYEISNITGTSTTNFFISDGSTLNIASGKSITQNNVNFGNAENKTGNAVVSGTVTGDVNNYLSSGLTMTGNVTGTVTNKADSVLTIKTSGSDVTITGSIVNEGTSATNLVSDGTNKIEVTSKVTNNGNLYTTGTVIVANIDDSNTTPSSMTYVQGGTLTVSGNLKQNGLDIANGATLSISASGLKITSATNLNNAGTILLKSGDLSSTIGGTGKTRITSGSNVSIASGSSINQAIIEENGSTLTASADSIGADIQFEGTDKAYVVLKSGKLSHNIDSDNLFTSITDNNEISFAGNTTITNLSLGAGSAINLSNSSKDDSNNLTVKNFNAGSSGKIKFDVAGLTSQTDVASATNFSDKVIVIGKAEGTLEIDNIVFIDELFGDDNNDEENPGRTTQIVLFEQNGSAYNVSSDTNFTINDYTANTDDFIYMFAQHKEGDTFTGALDVQIIPGQLTLQNVIAAHTTIDGITYKIDSRTLSEDYQLGKYLMTSGSDWEDNVIYIQESSPTDTDVTYYIRGTDGKYTAVTSTTDSTLTYYRADYRKQASLGSMGSYSTDTNRRLTINGKGYAINAIDNVNAEPSTSNTSLVKGLSVSGNNTIVLNDLSFKNFKASATDLGAMIAVGNGGTVIVKADSNNVSFTGTEYAEGASEGYAISVDNGGNLILTASEGLTVTFTTGTNADRNNILNNGTMSINGSISPTDGTFNGTVELYGVNGNGETKVFGGTATVAGSFIQNKLSVSENANIEFNNSDVALITVTDLIDNNGNLTLNGNGTLSGVEKMNGTGTLVIAGNIGNTANSIFKQGIISVNASTTFTNLGSVTVNNLAGDGSVENSGSITVDAITDTDFSFAALSGTGSTKFVVTSGSSLNITEGTAIAQSTVYFGDDTHTDGTANVAGTIEGNVENNISLMLKDNAKINGELVNDGTTTVADGTVTLFNIKGSGSTSVNEGATVEFKSTTDINLANGITNNGTVKLNAGTFSTGLNGNGNLVILGDVTNTDSNSISQKEVSVNANTTLTNLGSMEVNNLAGDGKITNESTIKVNVTTDTTYSLKSLDGNGSTTFEISTDTSLKIAGTNGISISQNNVTFGSDTKTTGTADVSGSLTATETINNWLADKLVLNGATVNGSLKNNAGATLVASSANTVSGTLTNNNVLTVESGTLTAGELVNTTDNLTVNNGSTLHVLNNVTNTGASIINNGTLKLGNQNSSKMTLDGITSGTGLLVIDTELELAGTGEISQGTIAITSDGNFKTSSKVAISDNTIKNDGYLRFGNLMNNELTTHVSKYSAGNGKIDLSGNNNIKFNSTISDNEILFNSGVITYGDSADLQGATLTINPGATSIDLTDGKIADRILAKQFNLNTDISMNVEFDLTQADQNDRIDQIQVLSGANCGNNTVTIVSAPIDIKKIISDRVIVASPFVDGTTKNVLKDHFAIDSNEPIPTPLYNYIPSYSKETGLITFTGGDGYSGFNPSLFVAPVAAENSGYYGNLIAFDSTFEDIDNLQANEGKKFRLWERPYVTIEENTMKNGPKVKNTMYGTITGKDSAVFNYNKNWKSILTAFVGYDGSHQRYDGIDIHGNAVRVGGRIVFYNNNFYIGGIANTSVGFERADTAYGLDRFTMLTAGFAARAGYSFKLMDDKLTFQPSAQTSYTFVSAFDYKTTGGVDLSINPLTSIELTPGLKVSGIVGDNWEVYTSGKYVWTLVNKTSSVASAAGVNVKLPSIAATSFVQFGAGVQKDFGNYSVYIQTDVRCLGRLGTTISGGVSF